MGTLAGWKGVVPPSALVLLAAFATATTASTAAAATNLALEEDLGKGVGRPSPVENDMLALLPFSLDCSIICDLATNSLNAPGPIK